MESNLVQLEVQSLKLADVGEVLSHKICQLLPLLLSPIPKSHCKMTIRRRWQLCALTMLHGFLGSIMCLFSYFAVNVL